MRRLSTVTEIAGHRRPTRMADVRTWQSSDLDLDRMLAAKRETVSVILPAREVAGTIGGIVEQLDPLRAQGLVDEVLVVDAGSRDGTAALARGAGARVCDENDLLSGFGPCLGKGDAMWRAVSAARGELLAFADADTTDFVPGFVAGTLGPLLLEPGIDLVKGSFVRHFQTGREVLPRQGGRVTELLARPLLNLRFPELAFLDQPLAGESAIRREIFEQLHVPVGYGVEIAMLIDVARISGPEAIGQVQLGTRQNRHQSLSALSTMAYEVLIAAERRREAGLRAEPPPQLPAAGDGAGDMRPLACEERPPLAGVHEKDEAEPGAAELAEAGG